jgi:hypothetical protein
VTACGGSSGSSPQAEVSQSVASGASIPQFWPLTGLKVPQHKSSALRHPVLVAKMDNTPSSQPQVGLSKADLVVEELVEGGLTRLAALSLRRGDVAQAAARWEESLAIFRAIGEQRSTAAPLRLLGRLVARHYGDYARADALLAESLRVWQDHDGVAGPIHSLLGCVDVALLRGEHERAARLLATAEAEIARCCGSLDTVTRRQLESDAAGLRQALSAAGLVADAERPLSLDAAIRYALEG